MSTSKHTNDKKVTKTIEKIMKIINKEKLNIPELLVMYGNLGYFIGASMAQCKDNGPTLEELKDMYYKDPTVDVGLMMQGLLMTSWEEDYIAHPKLSKLATRKQE